MNPLAGGAEAVTFEIAKRLVRRGDKVEWFSAGFPGAAIEQTLDGVHIVRAGRQWSVHWRAYRRYRRRLSGRFDVVVDQINTVPFFAPFWARIPTVMFIHQLAREVWWYESPFPLSLIGFVAEPLYLRIYRHVHAITVSESTANDLKRLGFDATIAVIREGIEAFTAQSDDAAPNTPSCLYVGRLAPSKRVSDVIEAFAMFRKSVPDGRLALLGDGPPSYIDSLRQFASKLGVADYVRFAGRVSASEKHREMALARMLVLASAREGWGLVVTEANAFGTPAVAYDVPGLRDSIRHNETGLLVSQRPEALASAMLRLWTDSSLYVRLSKSAREWSRSFSFDNTAMDFRAELERVANILQPVPDPKVRRGEPSG